MKPSSLPTDLKIAFCTGGSGGHLFPAIAVLEELCKVRPQTMALFLTSHKGIDDELLTRHEVQQHQLSAVSSRDVKRNPITAAKQLWNTWSEAQRVLVTFQPHIVIGCGGYVSVPGILAAKRLKIPRLLLEQNVVPGRATSLMSRISCGVCTSFSETLDVLPHKTCTVWTGNPVRSEFQSLKVFEKETHSTSKRLLILGGSQGATAINDAMLQFVENNHETVRDWTITHQTGTTDRSRIQSHYDKHQLRATTTSFIPEIATAYENATVIVTRGGATSLAEIACAGRPTLIVPYPNSVRDHQLFNAKWYADRHAALLVEQTTNFEITFAESLKSLLNDSNLQTNLANRLRELAIPHAATKVVRIIENRLST